MYEVFIIIFNMLIHFSGPAVERHLSVYFDRVSSIVETTGDPFHLVELCQLIIQCMEVQCFNSL
jgi:hypothetical protein